MSMRIGGLASGMDIDQIVSDLMTAEKAPLNKLEQDKQVLEWQQEDYRAVNAQLSTFRESLFELKLERTFNVKSATSSDEDVVEVTASNTAIVGTNTMTVTQMAEGAFKTSSSTMGSGETLDTLNAQLGLTGTISFSINGENFTVNADTESIYDLTEKINDADIGVQASYDSNLDRFFLSTNETGLDAEIEIVDGLDGSGTSLFGKLNIDTAKVTGKNAEFKLNGAEFSVSSNEVSVNGITYALKGVSAVGSDGQPVSTAVSVEADTESVFQTIMDFVDLYNETIGKINSELNEEYYRDYAPLSDEEREQLDEDQIEKWTEKAKSGLLKNDSILSGVVNDFRSNVYGFVEGLSTGYDSLADIGITTGYYTEQGKLYVDEDELRTAIEAEPEAVKELFTSGNGVAVKLYDDALNAISKVTEKAGTESDYSLVDNSVIGRRLTSIDERIEELEDSLEIIEERYWTKFNAMERAINIMNSQYSWMTSMLGTNNE